MIKHESSMKPAQRLLDLPANFFSAVEQQIQAYLKSGRDVIRLDIGSPDLPPAAEVVETLAAAASRPDTHGYQPHIGPAALRQAWADMYTRVHEVELDPNEEVLPLLGSKEGIFNLMMAWINPGDVVLIPDPSYMTYTRGTLFAGGEPYFLPLQAENGYLPDLGAIPADILSRGRVLWLNYPNNPTGAVADEDLFPRAVELAREYNLLLCHDAAYTQVCFDGYRAPSILEIPGAREVAVEFNSLSKSHNMPGWRVGALVGNPQALKALFRVKSNLDSGHFRPILDAAVSAMNVDQKWLEERNLVYQKRRDLVVGGLRKMGLKAQMPKAAIYVWIETPAGKSDIEFAASVLEQVSVSLTPGSVFGTAGKGAVRLALTTSTERLEEAMQRLQAWQG